MGKRKEKCIVCGRLHSNATFYCDECLKKMYEWSLAEQS